MIEFVTSSFCNYGDCVEIGRGPDGAMFVRDTKNRDHGILEFTRDEWDAFVKGVKAGEFDPA